VPKVITPQTRVKYDSLRRAGHTRREACKRAGVSESWAKKRDKELEARGKAEPPDAVAPKVIKLHQQGRGAPEVAAMTGLPAHRVADIIKHGAGYGSGQQGRDEENAVGPIPLDELSPVARDCLGDFERFRARYLGSKSTPWQVEAANRVVEYLESPIKEYTVVNCPQGGGKTRLFSHDIPAWVTARQRNIRGIFGSLAQNVSTGLCANLRDTLERTVPAQGRAEDIERGLATNAEATLAAEYGMFKPTQGGGLWRRDSFIVEQHGGVSVEKEPTWAAFSREAKFLGWRVDFMVWDDLVNTDMLRNQDRVDDLYRWWDDEAQSRLDPGGLLLLVGQRLRGNDIYRFCLDKKVEVDEFDDSDDAELRPKYHHVLYKAHYDDRCVGAHRKDAPPYPDGCMLDPARITWRDIKEKQADGNYQVVYQQEDTDPSEVLVQKEWVYGGLAADRTEHAGCFDKDRGVGELPKLPSGAFAVRYMTVDPSPTKWWSVQDWLYVLPHGTPEQLGGYRYLLNHVRKKMGANDFLDYDHGSDEYVGLAEQIVSNARTQGCPVQFLILEKNAAQRWAMQYDFFTRWKQTRRVQVIPHETTSNKSDADLGVWATLPNVYKNGLVRLPGRDSACKAMSYPLVREVTTYPNGSTDDCVMSQWFGEYNLQHLVTRRHTGARVSTDIPSWMKER
jgi:hypothetical protein